jgi:multimeric flavodoxin WrbA
VNGVTDTPVQTSQTAALRALALVCTLNPSPARSSSQLLAEQVLEQLATQGAETELIRVVDHDVHYGVTAGPVGDGDAWPSIRERLLAADILVLATPIWIGNPSSIMRKVLERLDGELSESDDQGHSPMYGKVGVVAVVGNEDGAHMVSGQAFQGLDDIGFTIPAGGVTYWVGRAMEGTDYQDLDETPEAVASTTTTLAINAAHLARLLRASPYPPAASS